jgi:EF hand
VGSISKSKAKEFFKDALDLFALRRMVKPKDLLAPGVSMGRALEESFKQLDKNGTGTITFAEFEEFINEADLEEALALITGNNCPVEIRTDAVQLVDNSHLAPVLDSAKAEIVYRDYDSLAE